MTENQWMMRQQDWLLNGWQKSKTDCWMDVTNCYKFPLLLLLLLLWDWLLKRWRKIKTFCFLNGWWKTRAGWVDDGKPRLIEWMMENQDSDWFWNGLLEIKLWCFDSGSKLWFVKRSLVFVYWNHGLLWQLRLVVEQFIILLIDSVFIYGLVLLLCRQAQHRSERTYSGEASVTLT